jgi:small-conductance mechanosensitive channel
MIGDTIQVGTTLGTVESIDLLSVKLKTFDNRYVRLPNETMIKTEVVTITKYPIRRAQFMVGVAYKEDLRKVMEILMDIANTQEGALSDPPPLCQIDGFGDSSININFGVWTDKDNVINMKTALIIAIKERFDREGIEIPFPHLSLYAGEASEPIKIQSNT